MGFNIEVNEGPVDRAARIAVSILIAFATYVGMVSPPLDVLLYIFAAILFLTGVTGFCSLYKLMGISTLPKPAMPKRTR